MTNPTTIPHALTLLVLCGCAHSTAVPEWRSHASLEDSDRQQPSESAIAAENATPPRFPSVGERRLPGAKLWLVEKSGTGQVRIRVSTRRGNDGAYDEENMHAMLLTIKGMLDTRLPEYEVQSLLTAHLAALDVVVRTADTVSALQSIGEVIDGPIDEALARSFLRRTQSSSRAADPLRSHLFRSSSEPLIFRATDALELCRNERFSSSDRLVTIVGDFDTSEVITAGAEVFGVAHEMPRAGTGELRSIRPERVSVTQHTDTFGVALALAGPDPAHDDYELFNLILTLAAEPLPLMPSDHVEGPAPEVSHDINFDRPGVVALLGVDGSVNDAEALVEGLFRYHRELITRPYTARAIDHARRFHWAIAQTAIDEDPSDYLVAAFIRHLIPSQFEARLQGLEELRPERVLEVTRRYFDPRRIVLFVVGPQRTLQRFVVVRNGNGFRLQVDRAEGVR